MYFMVLILVAGKGKYRSATVLSPEEISAQKISEVSSGPVVDVRNVCLILI